MSEADSEYFQFRAEQELERAQRATKPEVVAAHYALSELYLERVVIAAGHVAGGAILERGSEAPEGDPSAGETQPLVPDVTAPSDRAPAATSRPSSRF